MYSKKMFAKATEACLSKWKNFQCLTSLRDDMAKRKVSILSSYITSISLLTNSQFSIIIANVVITRLLVLYHLRQFADIHRLPPFAKKKQHIKGKAALSNAKWISVTVCPLLCVGLTYSNMVNQQHRCQRLTPVITGCLYRRPQQFHNSTVNQARLICCKILWYDD